MENLNASVGEEYFYDDFGRTIKICCDDGLTKEYTYDDGDRVKTLTVKYGVTTSSEYTYTFNGCSQLAAVTTPDGGVYEYSYDPDGLRYSKTSSEKTIQYLYQNGNIIVETDGAGLVTAKNIWGYRLLERETGDVAYSYLFNGHGDITALTDENGNVLEDYSYDPYGNAMDDASEASDYHWQADSADYDNPFRYCGEYLDSETNVYYLRARNYDPTTGRFLSEDPARAGLNLYTYCNNNPIVFIDPNGLDAIMANQTTGVYGNGHTSSFVQDKDGNWYFFYWGDTVSVTEVEDASVLSDAKSMNQWLRDEGLNKSEDIDYDGFCYITGDFTASLSYYLDLESNYETDIKNGKEGWFGIKNRNYNLVTRNCTEETMNGLMKGVLSDGTSVGDYYLGIYGIAVVPNNNLNNMQMAFMNSAYTRSGFNSQVSSNLQNAQSYLSHMYGDFSNPNSTYQKEAMQKIINQMSRLVSN